MVSAATGPWPFVYPSRYAPDLFEIGRAASTQDPFVCYKDTEYHNGMCNEDLDLSQGPTKFVDNHKHRFPIFADADDISGQGFTDASAAYLNCAEGSVCIFIRLDGCVRVNARCSVPA